MQGPAVNWRKAVGITLLLMLLGYGATMAGGIYLVGALSHWESIPTVNLIAGFAAFGLYTLFYHELLKPTSYLFLSAEFMVNILMFTSSILLGSYELWATAMTAAWAINFAWGLGSKLTRRPAPA